MNNKNDWDELEKWNMNRIENEKKNLIFMRKDSRIIKKLTT